MLKKYWQKILVLTWMCLAAAVPGFCVQMPTIEYEEFQLGSVRPGTQLTEVIRLNGSPVSQAAFQHYSYGKKLKGTAYNFADGLTVYTLPTRHKKTSIVVGAAASSDRFATPSGFAVGRPYSMVTAKYGTVIALPAGGLPTEERGELSRGCNFYQYAYGPSVMRFKVDGSGTIREVKFVMGS